MKHNEKIIVMLSRLAARRVSASQHLSKDEALNKDTFRATRRVGFTLIELLVVVLIIGILSAIALPQYTMAVEKAKATQAFSLLRSLGEAGQIYFLTNNTYPTKLEDLFIQIPAWTGKDITYTTSWTEWYSNNDWNVAFGVGAGGSYVRMERLKGPYRGAGFQWSFQTTDTHVPENEIFCVEYPGSFKETPDSYCGKIFKGKKTSPDSYTRVYRLP